jgi:hypothetical protein
MAASLVGLTRCISDGINSLQEVFQLQDRNVRDQQEGLGSKFSVYKLACGTMADFHKGLYARIGSPNLDFEATMRAEHCVKAGCNIPFTTSNYGISTTPQLEWQYIVGTEQLEEIDALDCNGVWYQAFVVKRTEASALVHFEGKGRDCDEAILLSEFSKRTRVRSKKGTIDETCDAVAARYIQLEAIDVKNESGDKWFPGFIIRSLEHQVLVHTWNAPGQVISRLLLAEHTRAPSKCGPLPVDMNDLVARYSPQFSKLVEECDIVDEDGHWHLAFAIRRPDSPSKIQVHFAGTTQDWDITISPSDAQRRLRTRSTIGPLGEVGKFSIVFFLWLF